MKDPTAFAITRGERGRLVVLSVFGALDILTAPDLSTEIHAVLGGESGGLIVDLGKLEFLASAGMAALVDGHRTAAERIPFAVVADGPATSRPLEVTGLTELFPVYATLEEAVTELAE